MGNTVELEFDTSKLSQYEKMILMTKGFELKINK